MNRTKDKLRNTTYFNIPSYASPLTAGNRRRLLSKLLLGARLQRDFQQMATHTGLPLSPARFDFPQKPTVSVNVFTIYIYNRKIITNPKNCQAQS